jgi:hypothetical protein
MEGECSPVKAALEEIVEYGVVGQYKVGFKMEELNSNNGVIKRGDGKAKQACFIYGGKSEQDLFRVRERVGVVNGENGEKGRS